VLRSAFTYSPRPGPLGSARPWIAAVYLAPLAIVAFAFANPIVGAGAGVAALAAGVMSGAGPSIRQPLRWSVGLAVMIVAVNAIVSQRGATILLRGEEFPIVGQIDISAEALAEGFVLAMRIIVSLIVFAVWSACVDPDRVLRAIRPLAARSALTATLIARLVPLAAADGARMAEAGRLRGPAAAQLGRAAIARRLIAGSLDRSVDIAATLELRGYGLGTRSQLPRHAREPGEYPLLLAGAVNLLLLIAAAVAAVGSFDAYPVIAMDVGASTVLLAIVLPAVATAPFVPDVLRRRRRGRRG
jgi:energy-coupling factor transport system permease protein